jgi:transposase
MANQLKLAMLQALLALHQQGWSRRRIARELGIDRETVGRYLEQWRALTAKPAISHTGSDIEIVSKPAIVHTGSEGVPAAKPANSSTGSAEQPARTAELLLAGLPPSGLGLPVGPAALIGRNSECASFRELIQGKVDQGLSAQRIWQDLRDEHSFTHSYYSVLRFVRKLAPSRELPFRRLEKAPGEEVQVDFGSGAWLVGPDGKRQRTHVLRMVLSHSRKAYSEAITRQTTDAFVGCLENGFRHFGGVTGTVVIDNLKAAVTKADWFDPELNPKVIAFCQHYNTVMLPTKPYTPRHKGKVERGIDYVQENALKGRTFANLEEQNRFLLEWERTIADTRIHGTTRRQVAAVFSTVEKPALLPLPAERFPNFREAERKVHRDGHVEVERAYYSVPPEYLGRTVWVRWDGRLVRVFNARFELIATHVRHLPGSFSTQDTHLHDAKISRVERGAQQMLARADQLGPNVGQWAQAMVQERGVTGIRPLLGLLSLAKKHSPAVLDAACAAAHRHGAYRLRAVRQLAQRQHKQQAAAAPLLEEHPLIRPLTEYGQVVTVAAWNAVLGAGEPEAPVSPASKPPPPPSLSLFREDGGSATSTTVMNAADTATLPTE